MSLTLFSFSLLLHFSFLSLVSFASEPTLYSQLRVSYMVASPLGVPQQVIAINNMFPGPLMNFTTGNNLVVNVLNELDEDLLITWPGVQMRQNAWQDGVLGTNCPIPPKWNWTYRFQVKDQIGSFFYFPSLNFQRASGGFGPFVLNNREFIPIPFAKPDGEIVLIIGDWYIQNHTALRTKLDNGQGVGIPHGVLINGKGPYQYNSTLVPDGIQYETINVDPGKTYRIQVHNVGISTSLNFRIQNHNLLLVETEGCYTVQSNYTQFDIHVGQSYSFLVSMDQNASSDYYIVASARFVNGSLWRRVTGVAVLHYSNSKGPATGPLPDPPNDVYYKEESMNQARSVRQNTSASGAHRNPQGSYPYGSINITDTYVLNVQPPVKIKDKIRAAINGISFVKPDIPFLLADQHNLKGIYELNFPSMPLDRPPVMGRSIINATYKGFIEIVLQNKDTTMQIFHLDGHAAFVVGMAYGNWSRSSRNQYNMWDAISRSSIQVYSGGWTTILVSLDNVGTWNLRVENLDRWYLGQETYLRIVNPEENSETEMPAPKNVIYCGPLSHLRKNSTVVNVTHISASQFGDQIASYVKKHMSNLLISILGSVIAVILLLVGGRVMKCLRKCRLRAKCYHHRDLINATDEFSDDMKLPNNENMYWGTLDDGTQIAIKFLPSGAVAEGNFDRTVQLLSKLQHKHLVRFLGYSNPGGDQLLVYEFMQHRSLREALDNAGDAPIQQRLNWSNRLRIGEDVAKGIQYIHNSSAPKKAHGNLKSSNILLDEKMQAKVSSLFQTTAQKNEAQRDDILNIGIVLLELIMGRRIGTGDAGRNAVIAWVAEQQEQQEQPELPQNMLDLNLNHRNIESVNRVVALAMECANRHSVNRPTISTVLLKIRHAHFMENSYI